MARRRFSILGILFALLWIAGTNHCALEHIFSASASTAQGDCQSHPDKSSDSHKEGQPCATKSLVAGGEQLQTKAKVVLVEPMLKHVVFADSFLFADGQHSQAPLYTNESFPDPFSEQLISLSIASNAPPVTA